MRLSDIITKRIFELIEESEMNSAEIQRNEFASMLGCAPSQINYVLSSRFTPEQGYIIESRRGGGGYIRISRVSLNNSAKLMHIINSIGDRIDSIGARVILENCVVSGLIDEKTAELIASALSNTALYYVPVQAREYVRASIIKQMLLTVVNF